jgi:hypothetical protein
MCLAIAIEDQVHHAKSYKQARDITASLNLDVFCSENAPVRRRATLMMGVYVVVRLSE